ncbi:hypothetical protein [Cellulosimicrobium arenosum]|uniref:Uncharacterized protein n=1 Tax=Cellulosimicrobium arenosum TaxID=2708133 RepID=A0A927G911_9MICO|nr:hypothetical protein [Cellulosimicrobium arenosum]MBD8078784.1 hypothetical protein [Cellulosimicrobium arenosum]
MDEDINFHADVVLYYDFDGVPIDERTWHELRADDRSVIGLDVVGGWSVFTRWVGYDRSEGRMPLMYSTRVEPGGLFSSSFTREGAEVLHQHVVDRLVDGDAASRALFDVSPWEYPGFE